MRNFAIAAAATALAGALVLNAASAQTSSKTTEKSGSDKAITTSVKDWTVKQWTAMKKEWEKDSAKWSTCQKQSHDKKLSGRANWSYLYDCMKA